MLRIRHNNLQYLNKIYWILLCIVINSILIILPLQWHKLSFFLFEVWKTLNNVLENALELACRYVQIKILKQVNKHKRTKSTKLKLWPTMTWTAKIMMSVSKIHESAYFNNNNIIYFYIYIDIYCNNTVSLISAYEVMNYSYAVITLLSGCHSKKNCRRIIHDCIWNAEQASHFKVGASFQATESITNIPLQISSEI